MGSPLGLEGLAKQVAISCGFTFVPPIHLRRGHGGDWSPTHKYIRIGRAELRKEPDRLWYLLAHELAHAQANGKEGHSRSYWVRLAEGLKMAGRLDLLKYDFGYREAALRVAREYGVADVPDHKPFRFSVSDVVKDKEGKRWKIFRRFRRAGIPHYRLITRGWRWVVSEESLLKATE